MATMGGRYAWQSCSRNLKNFFLDFILEVTDKGACQLVGILTEAD